MIYIKNMVSLRCKMIVSQELEMIGIQYVAVGLGYVKECFPLTCIERELLSKNLAKWGLELSENKKSILTEKIINVIVEMIHYCEDWPKLNYSRHISEKLGYDYTYLANTFSAEKHITIQHFIIEHKIEKAKEFLMFGDLNLTEISYKLDYSSVAHLSYQFKKVTGYTPSTYKHQHSSRELIENV